MKLSERIDKAWKLRNSRGMITSESIPSWVTEVAQLEEENEALKRENERRAEIINDATVESAAEFIIISLTHDEYRALLAQEPA